MRGLIKIIVAFITLHHTAHARALVFGEWHRLSSLVPTVTERALVQVRVRPANILRCCCTAALCTRYITRRIERPQATRNKGDITHRTPCRTRTLTPNAMPPAKGTCSTPQIETKTKKEQHNEQHTAWRKLRVGLARCLWPHHAANHAGGGNESEVPLMTQGVGNATPGGSSGSRRRRRRPPRLPSLFPPSSP